MNEIFAEVVSENECQNIKSDMFYIIYAANFCHTTFQYLLGSFVLKRPVDCNFGLNKGKANSFLN